MTRLELEPPSITVLKWSPMTTPPKTRRTLLVAYKTGRRNGGSGKRLVIPMKYSGGQWWPLGSKRIAASRLLAWAHWPDFPLFRPESKPTAQDATAAGGDSQETLGPDGYESPSATPQHAGRITQESSSVVAGVRGKDG